MRVLWLVRRGLTDTPGGDSTQIVQTAAALRRLGVEIELSEYAAPPLAGFDLAHLFHLDRLWENHPHARRLTAAKLPFVLSTIWWPADEFDRAARTGVQGLLARTLGSGVYANLRVWQRAAMHAAATRSLRALYPGFISFRNSAGELLRSAAVILPNSQAEREQIERYFQVIRPAVIVPNAADQAVFGPPHEMGSANTVLTGARSEAESTGWKPVPYRSDPAPGREGVLCVGRIEPRKNQLALITSLRDTMIPLTIVGPVGRFNGGYARRCRRAGGSQTRFLHAQPPQTLRDLYHRTAVHACVSWYETPGLVNLEAALCGCAIVSSTGGCPREYLGDDAEYAEAGDPRSIRAAVERALARGPSPALAERIRREFTWDAAARATLKAYELALGRG